MRQTTAHQLGLRLAVLQQVRALPQETPTSTVLHAHKQQEREPQRGSRRALPQLHSMLVGALVVQAQMPTRGRSLWRRTQSACCYGRWCG